MKQRAAMLTTTCDDFANDNRMIAGVLRRGDTALEMSKRAVQKCGAGLPTCQCDTSESLVAWLRETARKCLLVRCKHVDGELAGS